MDEVEAGEGSEVGVEEGAEAGEVLVVGEVEEEGDFEAEEEVVVASEEEVRVLQRL